MKQHAREIDRLRALSRHLPDPPINQNSAIPRNTPETPPSARLRSLPDPPDATDDDRAIFGQDGAAHRSGSARILVLFAVVAALVAGGYFWMARPRPQPVPHAANAPAPALASVAARPAASGGSVVVVHVHGKVRNPGIVTLPVGSRVADAIKAAGGPRPGARTGSLNLARKLMDGEQIPVGVKGAPAVAAPSPGATDAGGPLDLNTATVDQLDQLPGVGPVLAQRIVDYRTQHGGFRSIEQLQEVSGIGSRRFSDLKSKVRV